MCIVFKSVYIHFFLFVHDFFCAVLCVKTYEAILEKNVCLLYPYPVFFALVGS